MNSLQSPRLTAPALFALTAAWIATVPNAVTMAKFLASQSAGTGLRASAFVLGGWLFVLTVTYLILVLPGLVARERASKLLCGAMLVGAAGLSYFSTFLGTQFDKTMVANIAQTNANETLELAHWRLFAWTFAVGVLPAILVWRIPMRPVGRLRQAAHGLGLLVLLALVTAACVYAQYSRYASAARNRDISFSTVAPANLIGAALAVGVAELAPRIARAPRGEDARQAYAIPRQRLLVLVVGETARAGNHGINGYARDNPPRMKAIGGYYFPDTESCGTATAISVPCIFSGLGRDQFSLLRGRQNETLIDVVRHSGARVLWLDNDSGCKEVCAAAEYFDLTGSKDPRFCPEPAECYDEMLLDGLEARIASGKGDTLVVLHLKGSHGPAYYKRYPPAFERFTPVCKTSDISACDVPELVNAYDNTILYTDHVVGEAIGMLRRLSKRYAAALLYVSDHGESLGESGLFLHGMPYAIAPREQTHVPMFAWVSPEFLRLERWDAGCMARQTRIPRTHDNVYATVLGFMEIESKEYRPDLDLFEPCDPPALARR